MGNIEHSEQPEIKQAEIEQDDITKSDDTYKSVMSDFIAGMQSLIDITTERVLTFFFSEVSHIITVNNQLTNMIIGIQNPVINMNADVSFLSSRIANITFYLFLPSIHTLNN